MRYYLLLFFTTSVMAQVPLSRIIDFNGIYLNESGKATAKEFMFDQVQYEKNSEFEIIKQSSLFYLITPTEEVELSFLPESVHQLENLEIRQLDIFSTENNLNLTLKYLNGFTSEKSLNVNSLKMNCLSKNKGQIQGTIDLCLNNQTNISSSLIRSNGEDYRDINILISNKNLNFSALIFGMNTTGNGTIQYDEINNKILIRIDKIKAGFFPVTQMVFDRLKEKEDEKFKVNRPYLEIILDTEEDSL